MQQHANFRLPSAWSSHQHIPGPSVCLCCAPEPHSSKRAQAEAKGSFCWQMAGAETHRELPPCSEQPQGDVCRVQGAVKSLFSLNDLCLHKTACTQLWAALLQWGIHFPLLNGYISDRCFFISTMHDDIIGRAHREKPSVSLYVSAPSMPAPLIPVKSFSITFLAFYQHLPYFTLGLFLAEHLSIGCVQQGDNTAPCRDFRGVMLPQKICSILYGLNTSFGILLPVKTFILGEEWGKLKISSFSWM